MDIENEPEYVDTCDAFSVTDAIKKAEKNGFEVITGDDNKSLLLDLDSPESFEHFKSKIYDIVYYERLPVRHVSMWASKSGNAHALVRLKVKLPAGERVAWELILGSDMRRGEFSLQKLRNKVEIVSMLFYPYSHIYKFTPRQILADELSSLKRSFKFEEPETYPYEK